MELERGWKLESLQASLGSNFSLDVMSGGNVVTICANVFHNLANCVTTCANIIMISANVVSNCANLLYDW